MKRPPAAKGLALVEAMVASAILAVGVLGAARLSLHAQASLREGRALMQAQTLASQALDCALANQTPCPNASNGVYAGQRYAVTLERSDLGTGLEGLQATVEWSPENGSAPAQRLRWQTRRSTLPGWLGLSSP